MSDIDYYKAGGDGYRMSSSIEGDSRIYNMVLALNELADGSQVLDIGCGDMSLSRYKPNLNWTGIDICERPGVIPHDLSKPPYPVKAASMDAVVCSEVLEHLFEPLKVIEEANRVLKTGGKFYVTVPNFDSLDLHLQTHREQVYNPAKSHSVEHIRWYTPPSMSKFLDKHGFEVLEVIGNSPHVNKWIEHARIVLIHSLPNVPQIQVDRLLGQMFPDTLAGFMITARKK